MGSTLEVVTALLDQGADIEAKEGTGKTPLLLAILTKFYRYDMGTWAPNEKVVNHLLKHGADPHAVDDAAKNAFELADVMHYMFSKIEKDEEEGEGLLAGAVFIQVHVNVSREFGSPIGEWSDR